jgi:hypothetical protein
MPSHMDKAQDKKMVKEAIEKHKETSKIHQMGLKKGGMPKPPKESMMEKKMGKGMAKAMMQKKAGRGR